MYIHTHAVYKPTHICISTYTFCEKEHSSGEEDAWESQLQSTESGGGEQFLLLDCRAEARIHGVSSFAGTGTKI